jgi:hypothetical protein
MAHLISHATTVETILKDFAKQRSVVWESVRQNEVIDPADLDYYSEHPFFGRSPLHIARDAFEEIEEAEAILTYQQEETCWAMKEILGF